MTNRKSLLSLAIVSDGSGLPSGTYFYRLQTDSFTETRTLVLVK